MTTSRTHSESVLARALDVLQRAEAQAQSLESAASIRFSILERVACNLSGIALSDYEAAFPDSGSTAGTVDTAALADELAVILTASAVPAALGLAALSETLRDSHQRQRLGSHFTDFRLAAELAGPVVEAYRPGMKVVDPAAGAGILLAAVAHGIATHGGDASRFIREDCFAADLQPNAIRGLRLTLASLCSTMNDVLALDRHVFIGDSLTDGPAMRGLRAHATFDFVIANPPWEKVRPNKHEVIKQGDPAHAYGSARDLSPEVVERIRDDRIAVKQYAQQLTLGANLQGKGDTDMYRLFLEWGVQHTSRPGMLSLLVPAGLVRSKNDTDLRRHLLRDTRELTISLFDNKSKFFAIDSRFKFVHLLAELGQPPHPSMRLQHVHGTESGTATTSRVSIPRDFIVSLTPELTIPEVRNDAELTLVRHLQAHGEPFGDPHGGWQPHVVREVDMTRDRPKFIDHGGSQRVPVIEGRMVHQHRLGAKRYLSGSGRSARWESARAGAQLQPQFWMDESLLPSSIRERTRRVRAGFCDITGQTNERTLLSAALPSHVVSGNKVPTIEFQYGQNAEELVYLWTAIANSFVMDWLLRRNITTTLNFFILNSLHFPRIEATSVVGQELIRLSKELEHSTTLSNAERAENRVSIDALVIESLQLPLTDVELILADFPLLDRSQHALPKEHRSTVTRDYVLSTVARRADVPSNPWESRYERASREYSAMPYMVNGTD